MYIVEFTDKEDGKKKTRLAVVIGDDVRFLAEESLSNPVQSWLSDGVLIAAGLKDPEARRG
jgi:hypothetical protein